MTVFKSVIFDLDGTLLDTLGDLSLSMNEVLAILGHPELSFEYFRSIVGGGLLNLAELSLPPEYRNTDTIENCAFLMRQIYDKRCCELTRPYIGIPELLNALHSNGICFSILSNKAHYFTVKIVEKLLPNWTFDAIFGERPGVPRKPDPAAVFDIINITGVPAKNTVFLGDSGTDMKTALAAGLFPAGASWGYRNTDELISAGAERIFDNPLEFLNLFM